jgi:hypothetical protein
MRAPALAACLLCACGSQSADPGARADLLVAGARFIPGALPPPSGGPMVQSLQFGDTAVYAGESDRGLSGALMPSASSVLLALDHDAGYWVVVAGVPAVAAPTEPTFGVTASFARDLPAARRTLIAEAVDAQGRVGTPATQPLTVDGAPLPAGPLAVHLAWSDEADLDLHVIDPDGVEIYFRHPSGYRPPPPPALPDPVAQADAPLLDGDSNGDCILDGRDQENVAWSHPPASGHYVVRVDAASLCGQPFADWRVDELMNGALVASVRGEALPTDTRGDHGAGTGRTVLEFDVP